MAIGKNSDFKVYQEQFQSGLIETTQQVSDAFNAASQGCIVMSQVSRKGDYSQAAFFKNTSGLVTRRDLTSVSGVTDLAVQQDELVSVKINRKIGPVAQTLDAFKKIQAQAGPEQMDFLLGTQVAKDMQVDQLNAGIRACRAALNNQSDVKYTVPSSGTITTLSLVDALAKFGDAANRVGLWVMHSKVFFNLVKEQIVANIYGVAGAAVASATPITLNRPVLVVDSPALAVTSGSPAVTDYFTLGLVPGAINVEDSETTTIVRDEVTGLEQLVIRLQGEFAYNVGVKGFKWDIANGGANPNDTALGTGTNWDAAMSSYKDFAGVILQSR